MKIIDFNSCKENKKAYGGLAGSKLGIVYEDADWILKFPKTTKSMKHVDISYTTAPLSEYIGSQIYGILGYDVHITKLGIKDGKLVVACKDFTSLGVQLQEFREIKNYYNHNLEELLNQTISDSDESKRTSLDAIKIHLALNPLLNEISGIKERFWDCTIIDGFINNNDRNSGNWGILRKHNGEITLAPIFDNGASFSTKLSAQKINEFLNDQDRLYSSATNTVTSFSLNDKVLTFKNLLELNDQDLQNAILRTVPTIQDKWKDVIRMINDIPNKFEGLNIISDEYKKYLIESMNLRLQHLLIPAFENIQTHI